MTSIGERIKQARELNGWTQHTLAQKIGVTQPRIAHVEGGFKEPSDDLLAAIALQTGLPLTFFFQAAPESLPLGSLLFRAHASATRRDLSQAHRHAQLLFEITSRLAEQVGRVPVTLPRLSLSPIEAARRIRQQLRVDDENPIKNLIRALERLGVVFLGVPASADIDAFALWTGSDNDLPVIAIADGRSGDRLRLSVAHELGHLVLHSSAGTFTADESAESEAFQFGAELLMPESAMLKEIVSPVTLLGIAKLKPKWGVSIQALIRRANDLRLISSNQYRYLFQQLSQQGWRTSEPKNLAVTLERPRYLRQAAEALYGTPLDYRKFAADAHVTPQMAKTILARYAAIAESADASPNNSNVVVTLPNRSKR